MTSTFEKRPSSLRCRSPEATLQQARELAARVGGIEAMEITSLDGLGVPVYMSRRPSAPTAAVTYGKGLTRIDAEVGAYMEAIECALAEPGAGRPARRWGTPRDVAGAQESAGATLELCPLLGRRVDAAGRLLLAEAANVETGEPAWVPAELVYWPAPDVGQSLFGATTNGLASGNSVLEASIHALTELVERDIWSLEFVRRQSMLVEPTGLPDEVRLIRERAKRQGLELVVRSVPNEYRLPFFAAFLFAPEAPSLKLFNGGWGCHFDRSIALTRAVAEVAQSRLAYLQGSRGEPERPAARFSPRDRSEADHLRAQIRLVRAPERTISFGAVDDVPLPDSLDAYFADLIARVRRITGRPIYRAAYTADGSELHVVRLIAPMLEHFRESHLRVGPRLKVAIDAGAGAPA